jgi:multiple sugar transport system permease protein
MSTASTLVSDLSWRQRGKIRKWISRIISHVILLALGLAFALPFFWLITSSLKAKGQLFMMPPQWIPDPIRWSNYPEALTYIPYFLYLKNTLTVALFSATANTAACSFVAYGFSRIQWPGRNAVFMVLVAIMMLPTAVRIVPEFVLFSRLKLVGGLGPLMWPFALCWGGEYLIFLLRQFYLTIPMELSDAAKIDGCSEFGIFFRILVPLSKPALVTVWIIEFIWHWNTFLRPLIYLNKPETYTLALGLYGFLTQRHLEAEWHLLMAASLVTTLPIIALFLLAQRAFVQGISVTGIKG